MTSLHKISFRNVLTSKILYGFMLLIITSPYRCDSSDSNLSSGTVNITNSFISNSKTSSKSGIDATITNDDIQNGQQIPLVRLPSNTLLKYTAYKDVSIQHFLMPMNSRSAMFSFKSYEESKSALSEQSCYSKHVNILYFFIIIIPIIIITIVVSHTKYEKQRGRRKEN